MCKFCDFPDLLPSVYDAPESVQEHKTHAVYSQCDESCTSDCGHCKGRRFGPYALADEERNTAELKRRAAFLADYRATPSPADIAKAEAAHRKAQPLAQLSSRVEGESACEYKGDYLPHHSDDLFEVHTGAPKSHLWCGFHLQAIGVKDLCKD